MKRQATFVAVLLLNSAAALAETIAVTDSFFVPSLDSVKKLIVLLPSGYDASKRYPALYLLHGLTGSFVDWTTRTSISKYVADLPLIVVMPDADDSWYVNSVTDPRGRYEDYIAIDLLRFIQQKYSVDTARQAIAGLSMGGYGSLLVAMKHPNKFRFAGSLSGVLAMPGDVEEYKKKPSFSWVLPSLEKAYGEKRSTFPPGDDVFTVYKEAEPGTLPYIYMAVGIQDGLESILLRNRALADSLRAAGAWYEYREVPGKHDWKFWDREIQPVLKRIREVLKF